MSIKTLRKEIIKQFSSEWSLNDEAHRVEHFEDVFQTGKFIRDSLNLDYSDTMILFAAYFHDMFARSRENHHELSYVWMMTTKNPLITSNLTPIEGMMVADACHQHRASFKGTFKSKFCELINSADRGKPGDIPAMLNRAIKYREAKYPEMSKEERLKGAIEHLKEKYGTNGYARYPDMYLEVFGKQLKEQQAYINQL